MFESFKANTDRDQILIRQLAQLINMSASVAPPGGLATQATLVSVLNAIVAADQDIEILLVRDLGNGGLVVQQITDYQTGTPVVSYKDVNGAVYVPVGPIEYLDPSGVLNLILTQITAINNKIITDDDDGALATDQTLPLNMSILYAEGDGVEVRLKTDYTPDNRLLVSSVVTSSALPTGAATEATLNLVDSSLAAINTDIQLTNIELANILSAFNAEDFASQTTLAALLTELQAKADLTETQPVSLPTGVHSVTNSTVVSGGSVPAGAKKVYFQNIGTTDATVLGGPLEPGVSIPFEAEVGKTLPAFAYVASATAILKIVTVV